MATYDQLHQRFDQLNKKAQQLCYHNLILAEWLPNARAALESVATGNYSPAAQEVANKTLIELDGFSVKPETLSLLYVRHTPVPPVDVDVLKRYRGLLETLPVELDESADSDKGPGRSIATHGLQRFVDEGCGVGASASALEVRNAMLEKFLAEGCLAPFQSCMPLDDVLLEAIAAIPFNAPELKPQAFIQHLQDKGVGILGNAPRESEPSGDKAYLYERLQHRFRGLSAAAQQQEYASNFLNSRTVVARRALETLAGLPDDPEVAKLVREKLGILDGLSRGQQVIEFFQEFAQGHSVPPVDPLDIKRLLKISCEIGANQRAAGLKGGTFVNFEIFQDACSPGANVAAVWFRSNLALSWVMLYTEWLRIFLLTAGE
jgi:hypothetical protein